MKGFPCIAGLCIALASCGQPSPSTTSEATTFDLTRETFITAFNQEAERDESGGLSDCGTEPSGAFSCRIVPLHRTETQAELQRFGVEMPGIADGNPQYVTLETQDGQLSRVMIAGDRRIYGAVQMMGSLANAARVLGGENARRELEEDAGLVAFIDGVGLLREPPPFGTQVAISRSYAEISCTLATEEPLVQACYLTPPGAHLNIHLR